MVAYSFQKRFVGHVMAGLEPGPWCPGMKRHTLRAERKGRQGHARPEQPVHLYTAMRTKSCRRLGVSTARVQIPVALNWNGERLLLHRREGAVPRSKVAGLAPIVQLLMDLPPLWPLDLDQMDEFARTDGFGSAADMTAFFDPPKEATPENPVAMDLVLIGWSPDA